MKPFVIPSFFLDPWDDLDDIVTVSQSDETDSKGDYTTPPDEF